MKSVVRRVIAPRANIELEEIDISTDAALTARYGADIPVLLLDGRRVAKYRVTETDLTRMLAQP